MPGEVRIVADSGLPHADAKDSFKINAPADTGCFPPASGEQDKIIKFNDLTGPKGGAKMGYVGLDPFPDKEVKPRIRHKYSALAYLRHLAQIDGDSLCGYGDDLRHMFFQFPVAPEEYWLCLQYAIFNINGVLWLCAVHNTTMNMGSRPVSEIACQFAKE